MNKKHGSICIEGADQSGKTVLCNKLSELLGFPIQHFTKPTPGTDLVIEYTEPVLLNGPLILDRSYVSELVYGDIFRGGSGISANSKDLIESILNDNNCILVYLKRENYVWEDREEMYTKSDNDKVIVKYDEVFPRIGIPKMQIDAFNPNAIDDIMMFYFENNPNYGRR